MEIFSVGQPAANGPARGVGVMVPSAATAPANRTWALSVALPLAVSGKRSSVVHVSPGR
jgi:hypothetical protein